MVPRILWAALLSSTAIYFVLLQSGSFSGNPEEPNGLMLPLTAVAAMNWIAAWILPEFLLRANIRKMSRPLDVRAAITALYPQFLILRLALAESVCVLGFVLAQQSGRETYYPFWAAGALIMVLSFPRELAIAEKLKALSQRQG
jgi:hypothetical protein